jgi:3-oxoacyl-[acyl-carrier protein] reductase
MLAAEGVRVVIGYANNAAQAERLRLECGAAAVACRADICSEEGRRALLDAAPELYGLVVMAGDPARGSDENTIRRSVEINFLAPILLARKGAERMKAAGTNGAIVLLASMQAVHVFESSTAYAAPKVALIHAARTLAKECGGTSDIRVNVVAPGVTTAGMAEASVRSGKYDRFLERAIPRFGRPQDIARGIRFFLEPDNYITGQVLTIDGGLTLRRDL